MCNSAGIIDFDGDFLDMVRSGIMTYGLYPSEEVDKAGFPLYPAMSLKSHVAFVKTVGAGFAVSYGSTYVTKDRTVIATIPVGYGDGYPRALSNRGQGDEVTLIGTDGENRISVEEAADLSHRFNYEFCCDINKRVPRVYIENGTVSEIADALI